MITNDVLLFHVGGLSSNVIPETQSVFTDTQEE